MSALADVRVVEAGRGVGAAFCGKLLRQLGARVVKVVPPEAGQEEADARATLRRRAERIYLDRGKETLESELTSERYRAAVRECDVLVRGVDPAAVDEAPRLRLEYDELAREHPRLVYAALTPFGAAGPAAGWAGGDLHAQALSGWVSANGNPDEPPLSIGYGVAAMKQGLSAAGAVVAALLARADKGRGEFVDVSESHVIAAMIRNYVLVYRWNRIPIVRSGTRAPGSSGRYPHATFPCKDGAVTVLVRSDVEWRRFVAMIGDPEWAKLERYQDLFAMATEYPEEVDELLAPWLAQRTKQELSDLAQQHGVALAPVRTADEVMTDVQFAHRGFFDTVDADGTTMKLPGLPAIFRHAP